MTTKITESNLAAYASTESFARGMRLYRSDAIFDTCRQGDMLFGKCEGSSFPYYEVQAQLDEGGIQDASCSCPYDWGGFCKHIVALLLTYIHKPKVFVVEKSAAELVSDLDKQSLVSLIDKLVEKDPSFYSQLKASILALGSTRESTQSGTTRKTQVSEADYRKQIVRILRSLDGYRPSQAYWMMGGMVSELRQVLDSAVVFLCAGDAEAALTILKVLLIEVGSRFAEFDDSNGELASFFYEIEQPLVEAILSANLSEAKRRALIKKFDQVIRELSDYGIDDLDVIVAALYWGWDEHPLDDFEDFFCGADVLNQAKLNILDRQNRVEEYLGLCLKLGQYLLYVLKQIELGEIEKAIHVAKTSITLAPEALQVAQKLREVGRFDAALSLAERGLEMAGDKYRLGYWLGPIEVTQGRTLQAINAYKAAFTEIPSLSLYQTLKQLSDEDWESLRPGLMAAFEKDRYANVLVDIYLYEEQWDAAIAIADLVANSQYGLVEKVVDGVMKVRPTWVIAACQKQAQLLIDKTQSKYYALAVVWLTKAKQAYLATGRESEWLAYLDGLKSKYSRRPSLQAELRRL